MHLEDLAGDLAIILRSDDGHLVVPWIFRVEVDGGGGRVGIQTGRFQYG